MDDKIELTSLEQSMLNFEKKAGKLLRILAIPFPHVNLIYDGIVRNIEKKQLIKFMECWVSRKLDEKIEENNKENEELLTHAILRAIKCSHEAQIERITDIIASDFIKNNLLKEDLINIVAELSENEAIVFNKIYNVHKDNMNDYLAEQGVYARKELTFNEIGKLSNIPTQLLPFYLNRLVAKGLLLEDTQGRFASNDKFYNYTQLGKDLFEAFTK